MADKIDNLKVHAIIGSRNYATDAREAFVYYATPAQAVEGLLQAETFCRQVWEPACGGGHIAEVLKAHGYEVKATDLIDRGYGESGVDFLQQAGPWQGDIITNPPFKITEQFIQHAIDIVADGRRVAMFLKLQYLEGVKRRALYDKHPPRVVYVASHRLTCAMNGDWEHQSQSAIAFAWYVWEKGFKGDPIVKWFN